HHSATGPQCLLLNSTDAVWYGESCTVQKPYICKIPSLPEAPTTTMRPAVTCPVPKPPCQEEWTHSPVSNKCYKFVGKTSSYHDALTTCTNLGAQLPSIHSDIDNAWFS
ncbi:CBN-CLEC-50 protein, partial [Aphelenchoides avenae]